MDRICIECGCVIEDGEGMPTKGGWVCNDCLDASYVCCDDCGEYIHRDSSYIVYDRYGDSREVCYSCRNNNYLRCTECGDWYHEDCMTELANGEYVCRDCRDDHYTVCQNCGEWYNTDDMYWNDRRDAYYCEYCWDNDRDVDERIRDYHDNPRTRFYGDCEFGRQHHIGFELEIDRERRYYDDETNLLDDLECIAEDRLYFMHDGSLDNGFEIISQPHTMHELVTNLHIDKILNACIERGYKSHDTKTCGLHFHLSREMFGPEQYRDTAIQKMMLFYDSYYNDIVKISRRSADQLGSWCERCSCEDNTTLNTKERAAKYKQLDNSYTGHGDRYKAVNTTNRNTIEIRIMRGTLKYETFMASLDFVYTIARNSRTISWNHTTDATYWLKGLKASTIEYIKQRNAFIEYLQ